MVFRFVTEYPECVSLLFAEFPFGDWFTADFSDIRAGENVIKFRDETFYSEIVAWATHAFGCGLISRPSIERV